MTPLGHGIRFNASVISASLMINGRWVAAENGYYTIVMDSNITVNGVE